MSNIQLTITSSEPDFSISSFITRAEDLTSFDRFSVLHKSSIVVSLQIGKILVLTVAKLPSVNQYLI